MSKVNEQHAFKDREPLKGKIVTKWNDEEKLQHKLVNTIQQMRSQERDNALANQP
jgi:hypothetical protein